MGGSRDVFRVYQYHMYNIQPPVPLGAACCGGRPHPRLASECLLITAQAKGFGSLEQYTPTVFGTRHLMSVPRPSRLLLLTIPLSFLACQAEQRSPKRGEHPPLFKRDSRRAPQRYSRPRDQPNSPHPPQFFTWNISPLNTTPTITTNPSPPSNQPPVSYHATTTTNPLRSPQSLPNNPLLPTHRGRHNRPPQAPLPPRSPAPPPRQEEPPPPPASPPTTQLPQDQK